MFAEIFSTHIILKTWKKNPMLTKRQIGVMNNWHEDTEENNKPLSQEEVEMAKSFLKKSSPKAYYELFPKDK